MGHLRWPSWATASVTALVAVLVVAAFATSGPHGQERSEVATAAATPIRPRVDDFNAHGRNRVLQPPSRPSPPPGERIEVPTASPDRSAPSPLTTPGTPAPDSLTTPGTPAPDSSLGSEQVALWIPAIDVETVARPVGLQVDGAMETPDFGSSAWYVEGPKPGMPGPAVMLAHVDGPNGPDVFARLSDLDVEDTIEVVTNTHAQRFSVVRVELHPKDQLPAEEIWSASDTPLLRLITCGGSFDHARRSYRDNVIVWAEPTAPISDPRMDL